MTVRRGLVLGSIVGIAASTSVGSLGARPAVAAGTAQTIVCTAAGATTTVALQNDVYSWKLVGSGSCQGSLSGTLGVALSGSGSSFGLGDCSGDPAVTALRLNLIITLTNYSTGVVTTFPELWDADVTSYPAATAFNVEDPVNGPVGAGVLVTHIFAKCPPGGSSSTSFQWSQGL